MMYLYILRCGDGSLYTGITNDMERRLKEHESGFKVSSYSAKKLPVELAFCERIKDPSVAIKLEKQIKGWRREKKEALIRGEFDALPDLAARKTKYQKKGEDES